MSWYLSFSPRPRPPDTTTAASSSFGPVASSTWRFVILAWPASVTSSASTAAAPPPDSSATNDFGRNRAMCGPPAVNFVFTSFTPPKTGSVTTTSSPSTSMSMLFVMTGLSRATDRRAAMSRAL